MLSERDIVLVIGVVSEVGEVGFGSGIDTGGEEAGEKEREEAGERDDTGDSTSSGRGSETKSGGDVSPPDLAFMYRRWRRVC